MRYHSPRGSAALSVTSLGLAAALALTVPATAPAQEVSLGQPTSTFPEDFGAIQTVRELPDGRVLVADPLGKALYLIDMAAGSRTVIGSEGQGPDEYLQPDAVWALSADSTLLVDLGNGRLVSLAPDLSFGPTSPIGIGEPRPGSSLTLALPQGVDAQGRVYARQLAGGMGMMADSADIVRIDRSTMDVQAVAKFKMQDRTRTTSGGPNNQNVSISPVPLSAEDAWGVAPDGAVVIARAGDYRVDWIGADGSVTRGPPQRFDALRIGTAEKEEWVRAQGQTGGGIGVSVQAGPQGVQMTFARGTGGGRPREIDNYQWPDRLPPFYQGRIPVDPEGRAWVRRHVRAGSPSTYDVFDRSGGRVGTVTLEAGKRVIGFGSGSVYAVSYDEFDLNYLEQYRMPRL